MTLARLYSNKEDQFQSIDFHDGLNVVIGEIRLQKDQDKDTHNLGKSTLCQLLDFCLLKKRESDFFLFRHMELFGDFVFYLEVALSDGRYLTIGRGVAEASKIWLHLAEAKGVDARELDDDEWVHARLPLERARSLVDGYLGFQALQPWNYRKVLGYLLRGQSDYTDVFRPSKFKGKDRDWKPFVLHAIGFNSHIFQRRYDLEAKKGQLEEKEKSLSLVLGDNSESSELDALIAIKQREIDGLQAYLDEFKLEPHDKVAVEELVGEIDERIGDLNDRRYEVRYSINQIEKSLQKEKLLLSTVQAKKLFEEAGILFEGQIKRSYYQLIEFNKDITEERRAYLIEDLKAAKAELAEIEIELRQLDDRRSKVLDQIGSRDSISKYKSATNDLVSRRADLESLKQRRERARELQKIKRDLSDNKASLARCDTDMQEEIDRVSGSRGTLFARMREEFSEIVHFVLGQYGLLSVSLNSSGHAEFKAEIIGKDGMATNADQGETYRKLLCVAFDIALLLAHQGSGFPNFVYHDDVLSSLDDRKKENLRDAMRSCSNMGIQQIVTAIDSDVPRDDFFDESEIILRLHDDGEDGRLFKMPEW